MPILTPRERLGSLLADRYRLDRILSTGGMSVVFEGLDVRSRKPIAVKLVKFDAVEEGDRIERFLQETELTVDLRHPHVVEVLDFGEDSAGVPYLVMELLRGESMENALERSATLGADSILRLLLPVMGALASAHDAGVVHRDVKPGNIFLSIDPRGGVVPKLIDFGIAKSSESTLETRVGAVLGTPEYMAPEQLAGLGATAQTDVWAMGAVLYRAISGRAPYAGATAREVFAKLARDPVAPLSASGFPAGLCAAIDRALAREPTQRYRSMREFAAALVITAREAGLDVPAVSETSAGVDRFDSAALAGVRTLSSSGPRAWRAESKARMAAALLCALGAAALLGHRALSIWSIDLLDAPRVAAIDRPLASEQTPSTLERAARSKSTGVPQDPQRPEVALEERVRDSARRAPDMRSQSRWAQMPKRIVAPSTSEHETTLAGGEFPLATEW